MSLPVAAEHLVASRKPWVLVDEVVACGGDAILCRKHISSSDSFLIGHFAAYSIYPGVLLLEGVRQAAGLLLERLGVAVAAPQDLRARFLAPVVPGNTVEYLVTVLEPEGDGMIRLLGQGRVGTTEVLRVRLSYPVAAEGPVPVIW